MIALKNFDEMAYDGIVGLGLMPPARFDYTTDNASGYAVSVGSNETSLLESLRVQTGMNAIASFCLVSRRPQASYFRKRRAVALVWTLVL